MNRKLVLLALMVAAAAAPPTRANPLSPRSSNKRLLADCMSKQMAASKTLSYYAATKICKDKIKLQSDRLTASAAPKTGAGR